MWPHRRQPTRLSVPGILQSRTLEWVAISFSNAWKWKVKVKSGSEVIQSCPTLSNPMDCSLPGSSVQGIFQARVLEWVAIAFSIWSEWPLPKSLQTIKAGEGVEKRECFCTVGGNVNWYSHYGRQYGDSLKKLGMKPPYDPEIPLLGIYLEEIKTEKDTCIPLFICNTIYNI